MRRFRDRVDAGHQVARLLVHLRGQDCVVLGLPRGGVPVASEVAEALHAPLDVLVVRKLGVPFHEELAMGAIGEAGFLVASQDVVEQVGVTAQQWQAVESRERAELERRVARYRQGREPVDLRGRVAVIVDDGIATGSTARVACDVARHFGASRVVLAAPVAPAETLRTLGCADEVVVVETPDRFGSVGQYYDDFSATEDHEVIRLLASGPGLSGEPGGLTPDVRPPSG
ncbi:phosphoribosyltransferase [Nocardioides sp.]|uniref:phosphoribosyltransferase n=1 Tax=Nocardioides sp. TaxID=35761 RepID=UPI003D0C78D5